MKKLFQYKFKEFVLPKNTLKPDHFCDTKKCLQDK